jgi:hypothetical protein
LDSTLSGSAAQICVQPAIRNMILKWSCPKAIIKDPRCQRMAVVVEFFRGISNLSHGHSTEVWAVVGVEGGPLASGSSGPRGQQLPWGTRCHRAYHARVWSIRPKFKLRHYRKRTSDLRVLMSTRPSALRPCWDRKKPRPRWAGLRLGSMPSRRSSVAKQFKARGLVPERKAPPKRGQVYCALLGGIEENFSEGAVLEPANPSRIPDPLVLEGQELVSAAVWETLARHVTHPRNRPQLSN